MGRNIDKVTIQNVGAGNTAIVDLPVGNRIYHDVLLEYREAGTLATEANTIGGIDEIRVVANGKVLRRLTPQQLIWLAEINGSQFAFQAGMLRVFFSEPWRRQADMENLLGWGTFGLASLQIEIDIAAAATTPTMDCRASFTKGQLPLTNIIEYRRNTITVNGTGELPFLHTPKLPGATVLRQHILEAADNDITEVLTSIDGVNRYNVEREQNDTVFLKDRNMNPHAGVFSLVYDYDQLLSSGIALGGAKATDPKVSEYLLTLQVGTATGDATLITEYFNPNPQV